MDQLPIIDISPLYGTDTQAWQAVATQIDSACREWGFFYIKGHPITAERIEQVQSAAKDFFARDAAEKLHIDITQTHHRARR
ncbi:2OG-Fe(II) oxygenase, partial [Pseudomonas syringae pv. actinidiae]|nr:2OG-Fe(II) oxygenase [Pseudomonas syringae pv. actinidiae]